MHTSVWAFPKKEFSKDFLNKEIIFYNFFFVGVNLCDNKNFLK